MIRVLLVLAATVALFFAAYSWPSVVLGTDGGSLSNSVGADFAEPGCKEAADGWRCAVGNSDGTVDYLVEVDWKGCWTAKREDGKGNPDAPASRSGCVTLLDHFL